LRELLAVIPKTVRVGLEIPSTPDRRGGEPEALVARA